MSSGAEGSILCIGADGRIDLEPAFRGVCNDFASAEYSQLAQKSGTYPDDESCQPCLDIPISAGCAGVFPLPNQVKPMSLLTTVVIPLVVSGTEFSEDELTSKLSAVTNPYLTFIRSIILLV